ncbi:MAG: methyltransferase domain-containing protein [Streptosporangiales bacterium]|nr:methyltransferase domain-containing protein [Streptosporangiales bacterium]
MNDDSDRAAALRRRLADDLEASGDLRSKLWRHAVETVPRHLFLTEFFQRADTPGLTHWDPVRRDHDPARWLDLVYQNETWVTQLDRTVGPHEVTGPVGGDPSSSSTLPGLVVRMLEDLDVVDAVNVLEIGTGSGYSTALMCDRLGEKHVTSIEVDPDIAARASVTIDAAGYRPRLVCGDGLAGDLQGAPYDRVIATCSVRMIPGAWLEQAAPGAVILATVTGWFHGFGLARLTVGDDGTAEGSFLPGTVSFMIARPQSAPALDDSSRSELIAATAAAEPRRAVVGGDIRHDWMGRFVAQLAAPRAIWVTMSVDGGPLVEYIADASSRSWAAVSRDPDDGWSVRQVGPVPLWDDIEAGVMAWERAGSPSIEHFRIGTDGHRQTVWLDTDGGTVRWSMSE